MAELLLELLSEDIPARMQQAAAAQLGQSLAQGLAPLAPRVQTMYGPRRIAAIADVSAEVPLGETIERGPRISAPDAAMAGFLRKHDARREQLVAHGEYWTLHRPVPARGAASVIGELLPGLLRSFAWPRSMRWGGTSAFTWVRPLRRILCLLDGAVVPFDLRHGDDDDGHGLASGDLTEGHRFMAPGAVAVRSAAHWQASLLERCVIVDHAARLQAIGTRADALLAEQGLSRAEDPELADEVAGLVEWPVPLLGRIDADYMSLPAEVMQVSMRVHQRYFALRDAQGRPAPQFLFVANIDPAAGTAAIVAGNERVLRARFADARYFWDHDRAVTLASRVAALDGMTFHARLGSQGDRVRRLERLTPCIAAYLQADQDHARRAAHLAKADLATGMVGEFPELQGVIGGYYAAHDGEHPDVCAAIRDQYLPKGNAQTPPGSPVTMALALADRLDTLAGFFGIGEAPRGSGDPYALRRAALGVIRYAWRADHPLPLRTLLARARQGFEQAAPVDQVFDFIVERLRIALRQEGRRHDTLEAVFAAANHDDIAWLTRRAAALETVIGGRDGADLLAGYRRAANILRIENRRDGPHDGEVGAELLAEEAERRLHRQLGDLQPVLATNRQQDGRQAMAMLSALRGPLDGFFAEVRVNDADRPELRVNRLRLLSRVVRSMDAIADFSKIEG